MNPIVNSLYKEVVTSSNTALPGQDLAAGNLSSPHTAAIHEKLKLITRQLAKQMGLSNADKIDVKFQRGPFLFSPLFFSRASSNTVYLSPLYLINLAEIPKEFHITDEKDPRLSDRTFLKKLEKFLFEHFKKNGYDLGNPGKMSFEIRGCELLSAIRALQDKNQAKQNLEFRLRHDLADIELDVDLKTKFLQAAPFAVTLMLAASLLFFTSLPISLTIITSIIAGFATKKFASGVKNDLAQRSLILALNGDPKRIQAARQTIKEGQHFYRTLRNCTDPDIRPLFKQVITKEGFKKTHPDGPKLTLETLQSEEQRIKAF